MAGYSTDLDAPAHEETRDVAAQGAGAQEEALGGGDQREVDCRHEAPPHEGQVEPHRL